MTIYQALVAWATVFTVVLFMVLPVRIRPGTPPPPGCDPGAPGEPMIGKRLLLALVISGALLPVVFWLVSSDPLGLGDYLRPRTEG